MKKWMVICVACLSAISLQLHAQEKQENKLGYFNSLSIGANVGSTGWGLDIATPIGQYLSLRAGFTMMPDICMEEKLDVDNGFLMCPNHDKLFDRGWITFDLEGNIVISDILNDINRSSMNINNDMKITLTEKNKKYLEYHRKNIFLKDKVDVF